MNSKVFSRSLVLVGLIALSACWKTHDLPAPSLSVGQCQYNKVGMDQQTAQKELQRVSGILEDSTIGNSRVQIITSSVYVSQEQTKGKKTRISGYGVQIVFSCDSAGIIVEDQDGYISNGYAQNAMNQRVLAIQAQQLDGSSNKLLDYGTYDNSSDSCDSCYDDDTGQYYDCNCSTDYDYGYRLVYAHIKANENNPYQASVLNDLMTIQSAAHAAVSSTTLGLADLFGMNKRLGLQDSLALAQKVLPENSENATTARQILHVFNRINPKKAVIHTGKTITRRR